MSHHRAIELVKIGTDRFKAVNRRGGQLPIGAGGDDPDFTPVELLLAGLAGCSAIDVDMITRKRAAATSFSVRATGDKIRDEHGNRLVNLTITFDVEFPEGQEGDEARRVLPGAMAKSRDRLCTVSRTVAVGTPVESVLAPQ